MFKLPIAYLLVGLSLCACSQSEHDTINKEPLVDDVSKNYTLIANDHYSFRRAYHGGDTLKGAEWEAFSNRPPMSCEDYTNSQEHPYHNAIVSKSISVNECLNLEAMNALPDTFNIQVAPNKSLRVKTSVLKYDPALEVLAYAISFYDKNEVVLTDTLICEFPPDLSFYTIDLDNDGTQELLTLEQWYIINGDNFDITIYDINGQDFQ